MFTGIIQETGKVVGAERRADVLVVRISAEQTLLDLPTGGSIAVNGCCLTAVDVTPESFVCELTIETLQRTAFESRLTPGVLREPRAADAGGRPLRRPHRAGPRRRGRAASATCVASGTRQSCVVAPPRELERYLVPKGSVAVDGISLTVADLSPGSFSVALIPYTLDHHEPG